MTTKNPSIALADFSKAKDAPFKLGARRARHFDVRTIMTESGFSLDPAVQTALERADLAYRTLCAILFNFVPQSGHPGGSISSGRVVQSLLFANMDYDISNPDAPDADTLTYAAGHKAMGLYAAWALRNEMVRISKGGLLPKDTGKQLRLEDLLGFRRNPVTGTPLFRKFEAKSLDGHPTPATPFVKLATGASGVGVTSAFGLAFAGLDVYGAEHAPWFHVVEGEGGMTPGRVQEALATAASAQLKNIVMHLDWNQASIDSNRVTREGDAVGDYVQWSPAELFYLNDWNVVYVPNGFDFAQVMAAQRFALSQINDQPTAIVYRTVKGWKYGIEGRSSHGAGHAFCSEGFYKFLSEFESVFGVTFPRFSGEKTPEATEKNFYDCMMVIRNVLEKERTTAERIGGMIADSRERLRTKARTPRADAPKLDTLYAGGFEPGKVPTELQLKAGTSVTLRGVLGDILGYLNRQTGGAIIGASADLLESTSVTNINKGFAAGFYNPVTNPKSRLLAVGGICEDAIGGLMAGLSSFGSHIGVGSSYGAFIAALQHVSARLHAIGQQTRKHAFGDEQKPFIIVCAHAGPKTGEDGPTHADPQALQLMQENFPKGSMVTLTPWDAQEIWPLMIAAFHSRPAVITPFVTRPSEPVVDRVKAGLAPASDAVTGVYALRKADPKARGYGGTVVLQGNGVTSAFVTEVLPALDAKGIKMNVYYVASAELFDLLPEAEKERIFPAARAEEAMGITEFTLSTMYRWVSSNEGRNHTLHPFAKGHFLGSGQANRVFEEGGLDGKAQLAAVLAYAGKIAER